MSSTTFTPEHTYPTGREVPKGYLVSRCGTHGAFAWKGVPSAHMSCPVCCRAMGTTTRMLRQPFRVVGLADALYCAAEGARDEARLSRRDLAHLGLGEATREELAAAAEAAEAAYAPLAAEASAVRHAAEVAEGYPQSWEERQAAGFTNTYEQLKRAHQRPEVLAAEAPATQAFDAARRAARALAGYDRAAKADAAAERYERRLRKVQAAA